MRVRRNTRRSATASPVRGSSAEPGVPVRPVSQAARPPTAAARTSKSATSTACTTNGRRSGAGPYWPSSPEVSGPRQNPAFSANDARRAAAAANAVPTRSCSQALPTLNAAPDAKPWTKRAV